MAHVLRLAAVSALVIFMVGGDAIAQAPPAVRREAAEHPRIAAAVRSLEDAIRELREAPHDFGGHKAAAIRSSEQALADLRQALAFRANADRPR